MPFSEHIIFIKGNEKTEEYLKNDPLLSCNLYKINNGDIKHGQIPENGLFLITDVVNPDKYDPGSWSIPWDALFETDFKLLFPYEQKYDSPPISTIKYLGRLSEILATSLCFYGIEMHGGDVMTERSWVFCGDQYYINYEEDIESIAYENENSFVLSKDILHFSMNRIGIEMESQWFEPFAGRFDWNKYLIGYKNKRSKKLPSFPSSLYRSVQLDDYESAKRCLEKGAAPNAYRTSILEPALKNRGHGILKLLLKYGAEIKTGYHNPLIDAEDLESVKILVENGAKVTSSKRNPLVGVMESGDLDAVNYLLEKGAVVNNDDDNRLFFAACKGGLMDFVKKLAMDLNAKYLGDTGLTLAAMNNRLDTVKWLIEKGAEITPDVLGKASEEGAMDVVKWLVENKLSDVNGIFLGSLTPLYCASQSGHGEIVKYLLEKGSDIKLRSRGESPLHIAVLYDQREVIDILLDAGIPINDLDDSGKNPLWSAVGQSNQELTDYLISKGADADITDNWGTHLSELAAMRDVIL